MLVTYMVLMTMQIVPLKAVIKKAIVLYVVHEFKLWYYFYYRQTATTEYVVLANVIGSQIETILETNGSELLNLKVTCVQLVHIYRMYTCTT